MHGLADCFFDLSDQRQSIVRIKPFQSLTQSELTEMILGPLVPLSMAHLDRFLLHSASMETDEGVTLICGDSGSGKSTISRCLHQHIDVSRLTDDITALADDGTVATGAPYPQLKLAGAGWSDQQGHLSRSVHRLVILQRDSKARGVQAEPADTAEAGLALVRHTVAVRLFDSRILKLNLALASRWATQLSQSGQVLIIRSADDPGLVPEIADRILTA